jgi:L-threonylcarbamoyladenylate synthase
MKTRIIRAETQSVAPEVLHDIVRVLRRDGVIVYPTETFYGLGANCFSKEALRRIFILKQRPSSKGLPVLVSGLEMAEGMAAEIPPVFFALAARFWPGPLTLVLKAAPHLPRDLIGAKKMIGIRLPNVPWLQALIRETGVPLITTSANMSGEGEIAAPEAVIRLFQQKVDLIVDGGPTPGGKPSTVIDLTEGKPALVREGRIDNKELREFV